MAKTRQQLLDEELARQKQSNIPMMGTQGVAQFKTPAQPFVNTGLASLVMNDPNYGKTPTLPLQGLFSAAPQPVPAPVANAPVQSAPLPAVPSFASVNAQADREAQRAAAESNANMIIGKSGLPQGFALGPQGQLIPERQLRAGLQSAVTPMAPITPAMTNQQAMATAARVGTNVATPMGVFSAPLNTNANFSASAPMDANGRPIAETVQQRAAREDAQFAASRNSANARSNVIPVGRTPEAQGARARQVETDRINQGLASAAQAQQTAKMQNELAGKVLPAQAAAMGGVDQEMVKRGLDPRTGQPLAGANQPANPVKDENGTWIDQNTGKLITSQAVLDRLDAQETRKADIEVARELPPAKKSSRFNPFSVDNVWGYNPKSGKFYEFDNPDELNKNKDYVPLSPEQQKAYEQGNKGLQSAAPAQQIPLPAGSTGSPQMGQVPAPIGLPGAGLVNQQGTQRFTGLQSAAQPAMVGQPAGNQYAGAKLNFGSEQEAEAAGLPPGTIITIAGRRARVK